MQINRILSQQLKGKLSDAKALLLFGPRQVGKTTLLHQLMDQSEDEVLWLNGDDTEIRIQLSNPNAAFLKQIIGNKKVVIVDEAQRIENIGLCLKIMIDQLKVKVIATGSSSFELANKINEPLTGRKWEYLLLPFSFQELVQHTSLLEEKTKLKHRLIYGYYPDVVNNPGQEKDILNELVNSYLFKDLFTWKELKKPQKLEKLLQALAFQVGSQVSFNELSSLTGLDNQTVERYIHLLEQAFVVFRLGTYSKNLRTELKKTRKIYFYDNGIRNAIIKQFNPLELRNDVGALWENFLISERFKFNHYHKKIVNSYFWRTSKQQEVDYLEEEEGVIHAYEFKWQNKANKTVNKVFVKTYPESKQMVIDSENFITYLLP